MAVIFKRNLAGLTVLQAFVLLSTLVALSACSSMAVESDWDTSVDFSVFQTFGMIDNTEPGVSALIDQRIRSAIRSDLESKGLRLVDDYAVADLAVGYEVATQQRATYHTVHSGWGASGFRTSHARFGASVGTSRTVRNDYTVGTMIIAVFRMEDRALIWEGSGSDVLARTQGPEESAQMINEAVQKILGDFPPGAGSRE
jgi:hypothetical protein